MGKERRIRLKFHNVLPTSKNFLTHSDDTDPYFYADYTIPTKLQASIISDSYPGLHLSFDNLLQNLPKKVKTVEFFEFGKNEIQKFKNAIENDFETNELDSKGIRSESTVETKKVRQHSEFLKKFDVVNHARRLYGLSDKKKNKKFEMYDVLPIYLTIPTLRYEVPGHAAKEQQVTAHQLQDKVNPSIPRKRLHSERLKTTILKENQELNKLKSILSANIEKSVKKFENIEQKNSTEVHGMLTRAQNKIY
ncbi:uncharacterized protein LOC123294176 [Chrysoperla carnea]|uniref:uncharacterized protein LOC123294176 n=1 Tax=Chrysoperla carnea TaxID=189513 RepID=UPI001D0804E4|nr:uncharacterized protein LOC123294176 [Chrysoperla carnea]